MNKTMKAIAFSAVVTLAPLQANAGSSAPSNVMDDAFYGAGVGAMVGLGLMLLSDKPLDNWSYVTRGLGVGIIAGATYGVFRSSRSFAVIEDGEIRLGVPTPALALQRTADGGLGLAVTTDLIRGTF